MSSQAAVVYSDVRFQNFARGDRVVVLVSAPGVDRVGVSFYRAKRYESYREYPAASASWLTQYLTDIGFTAYSEPT